MRVHCANLSSCGLVLVLNIISNGKARVMMMTTMAAAAAIMKRLIIVFYLSARYTWRATCESWRVGWHEPTGVCWSEKNTLNSSMLFLSKYKLILKFMSINLDLTVFVFSINSTFTGIVRSSGYLKPPRPLVGILLSGMAIISRTFQMCTSV